MNFGLREVLDSIEIAFDKKKVLYMFLGIVVSVLVFVLVVYIGGISGNGIVSAVSQVLGIILSFVIIALVNGAVSRTAYKEITSGEALSAKDALAFSFRNFWALVLTPACIGAAALLVLVAEYAVFLLGRIEVLSIVFAALTIPVIILNIFVITFILAGIETSFAIIAADETGVLKSAGKTFTLFKKAFIQYLSGVAVILLVGIPVLLMLAALLLGSGLLSLYLFGWASGFTSLLSAAADGAPIPYLSQIAWSVFGIFALVLTLLLGSFKLVFLKTSLVSLYLSLKEKIK